MHRLDVRKGCYFDSVFLMAVSADLRRMEALSAGHVLLATGANLQLLAEQGFEDPRLDGLLPADLIIALRAQSDAVLDDAAALVDTLLNRSSAVAEGGSAVAQAVDLDDAVARLPDANLALVSVPGPYAAFEARRALRRGLHVMIFSDNVSLEEEVALKKLGTENGLLVMGPDCGTALIGGKPLGFANRVRAGSIGLVGASGTGLQEIACQIHRLGGGVSEIIGTGGRDLQQAVGAATTLAAIELLAQDEKTQQLVVVCKKTAPAVAAQVTEALQGSGKPAVACFLGDDSQQGAASLALASTLEQAARLACEAAGVSGLVEEQDGFDVDAWLSRCAAEQRYMHGLFSGGTLGAEALLLLRPTVALCSNLDGSDDGAEAGTRQGHTLTDLGDDQYTQGRPHPMIDPTIRVERIERLGSASSTALLLLDVVLGAGSHRDPGGVVAGAVKKARQHNPGLLAVASITGTELDQQSLATQRAALEAAGVVVAPSNAAAARLAARAISAVQQDGPRAGGNR